MTIPIHVNNAQTTFGASYSPGGSTLVMATGFGSTLASRLSALGLTLDASNPIRVTAIKSTAINIYGQITDLSKLTIFQATGRSTDTLTGVTVVEGTTDQAYGSGDTLAFLWTAGAAQALRDAIVAGGGTVSSVAMTVPSGLSVSGSPITTSGTLAVTLGVSGLLKGSGGSIVAASAGTDYAAASHAHAASDITSGTMGTARLGSGTANSSTYLRGDQSWASIPDATPGGSSGTIQYNNAGAFGGFGSWDGTILGLASTQFVRVGTGTAVAQEVVRAGDYRFIHTSGAITNTFVGVNAGTTTITGTSNTGIGVSSMRASTLSVNSTCVGADSGRLGANLQSCTFVGTSAGYSAGSSSGTASFAILIGASAAASATTTVRVVVIGGTNLTAATSITDIQVIGQNCARSATNPTSCIIIGNFALYTATTITTTVALGLNAGFHATSSVGNVIIGTSAAEAVAGAMAGCTFVGVNAGAASPTPSAPSYAAGIGFEANPPANNIMKLGGVAISAVALMISSRSTVSDSHVPTGSLAIWFDDTPGATKVKFKGKDSGGTVRTGELALT